MHIADLAPYPDFTQYEDCMVAIGWLSPNHDFPTGQVPDEAFVRLQAFCEGPVITSFGLHRCEFCDNVIGSNILLIRGNDKVYVVPDMIVHYIQEHRYCPPSEFIEAVLSAEFIDGQPVQVKLTKKPITDPWDSGSTITARQYIHIHKNPNIIKDKRWYDNVADWKLFDIYDEGKWGNERCILMTELLKDTEYDRV